MAVGYHREDLALPASVRHSFAGLERPIADPWYTGDFDATYDDILAGCTALLAALVK